MGSQFDASDSAGAEDSRLSHGIKMIVGLGNPGSEYENTRHNSGFRVIDSIAGDFQVTYWKNQDGCLVGIGKRDGDEVILAKPQAFMNCSGGPVSKLMTRYSISPDEMLVIHDDLDLPPGSMRFKRKGGHGGHNGIKSIIEAIGDEFMRLKIGIGRPPGKMDSADYVLSHMSRSAREEWEADIVAASQMAIYAYDHGLDKAMLEYN